MRFRLALMALTLLAAPAAADMSQSTSSVKTVPEDTRLPGHEPDTYRFGQPYNAVRGTSPAQCEQVCDRDQGCAAWSYVPATFQLGPRCELKRSVGAQSFRPGAVSGIASRFHPVPEVIYSDGEPGSVSHVSSSGVRSAQATSTQNRSERSLMGGPTIVRTGASSLAGDAVIATPATRPAPAPTPLAATPLAIVRRPAPAPTPKPVPTTPPPQPLTPRVSTPAPTAPPQRAVPQFEMTPGQASTPAPAAVDGGVQFDPEGPLQTGRRPWTERTSTDPDYSIVDPDYIPGDEQATAGFLDGVGEGEE